MSSVGTKDIIALEFIPIKIRNERFRSIGIYSNGFKGGVTYKGISQVYNAKWVGWNIINRYLDKYPELKIPYESKTLQVFIN